MLLDQLLERLDALPEEARSQIEREAIAATAHMKWIPNPGPQTDAYLSPADVLLFGGEGGGGKTDLGLGLAMTQHQRSLVVRRQYTDLSGITDRAIEIHGTRKGFSGSAPPKFRTDDGRLIDFGAAKSVGDEEHWQGQPHDFLYIDEAVQFAESQVRFFMGWVRSAKEHEGQRTRVVLGTNPPLADEGDWVLRMFAPWLDEAYPDPAKPGELRWVITDGLGEDQWVEGPGAYPVFDIDGNQLLEPDGSPKLVKAMSRTFIRSSVKNNPYLAGTSYEAQLDNLPEPLRSAIRDGKFMQARQDHDLQLIPYAWVVAAQARWTHEPPENVPMCAIGADVASGGADRTVLSPRHDGWFGELIVEPGVKTPLGTDVAALVIKHRRDQASVGVDCGGGYGNAPSEHLEMNGVEVHRHLGAAESMQTTRQGRLPFFNKRAEVYYRFYEALDPDQPGGSRIALPRDAELAADLCAIRLDPKDLKVIKLEPKEQLVKRIGRSPDKGDAVVISWSVGGKMESHHKVWRDAFAPPKVVHSKRMGQMRSRRR